MLEEILREHAANGTTLMVCLVAAWRFAQGGLGAYRDRTTAIREAVNAIESATKTIGRAAESCERSI
jgi:hypothetical protein